MKDVKKPKKNRGELTGSDYCGEARGERKQREIINEMVLSVYGGEKGAVVRNCPTWGEGGRFDSVSICTRIPQDPFFQSLMPANLLAIFTQDRAILGNLLREGDDGDGTEEVSI
jgi:hypothetical protein